MENIHQLLLWESSKYQKSSAYLNRKSSGNHDHSNEWKLLTNILDRLFFIIFFIITLCFNIWMIFASPHIQDYRFCPLGKDNCPPDFDFVNCVKDIDLNKGCSTLNDSSLGH